MQFSSSRTGHRGSRRKSASRAGMLAVTAAAAGLCSALTARADITNGFSGFAPINFAGQSTVGSVGYSTNGSTFTLTDNRGSEATSGFYVTPQNVAAFDATYTYTNPNAGGADGVTFVIDNASAGTAALGAGGGGLGYTGIANSEALAFNIYTGYTVGAELLSGGTDNNAYLTQTGIGFSSGDQIQVTLEYFNNTLTANYVDLKTNVSYGKIYTGVNIPSAIGGSTGYVGFTGGTGGVTSSQQISNFTFVSGTGPSGVRLYQPIAITGFNQAGVISIAGGTGVVTATMDAGTAKTGDTWYEKGWNTYNTSTGIPTSGSTFTSQYDSQHVFTMPSYSGNDVVLLSPASPNATINFNSPSAYSTLSFLESCGHGPSSFKVTINYADGATATSGLSVITPDWFNGGPSAWFAAGRDQITSSSSTAPDNYAQANTAGQGPNLYEEDLILPDSTDPIASVSLTFSGTNTGTNMMIFAVSGVVANSAPLVTYTGAAVAGKFDTSTINFSQNSNGTIVPVAFGNGDQVIFDDTAVDTVHNITVASLSDPIKSGGLIFNNTTATNPYTFTGAGIGGPGGISVNGGGTVILDNPNTFNGSASINSGTLIIGSGGTLASGLISVGTGATFQVSGGSLTATGIVLNDSGTVNFAPGSLTLAGLNGTGVLTSLNATATNLTLTGSSAFSGSMSLGTGSVTVNANGSSVVMTGSNSYSGGTFLKAGTLQIGNSSSLGSGTLYLQGGAFGVSGASVNFSNFITGSALIVPNGGGNLLEISGTTNNFTGPVVIQSGGIVQLDSAGAIGGLKGTNASSGIIIVGSGGSLLINDQTGYLGLTGGVAGGAPITLQLSGTGNGGTGALTTLGGQGNNYTWAGNVVLSGPALVAPGYGTGGSPTAITLSGAITGNGTLQLGANDTSANGGYSAIYIAPAIPGSSNYSGETQIYGDVTAQGQLTVQLGANNALSSASTSGLNFNSGSTGSIPTTLDLHGYNQSVGYLTNASAANLLLTNSQGNLSTLTVSNGNLNSGAGASFSVPITGNIAVVKTGQGNQALAGLNTYNGGTNVAGGTLSAASSTAFGTGSILLAGGTLGLAAPGSISGFGTSSVFGTTSLNGATATLTPGNGAIFTNQKLNISDKTGFTTTFTYDPTPTPTTGYQYGAASFIIGTTTNALSGEYGNSNNSQSIELDTQVYYDNADYAANVGEYIGFSVNGSSPAAANVHSYAFNTWRSDPIQITLTYAGGVLSATFVDTLPVDSNTSDLNYADTTVQYDGPNAGQENPASETFTFPVDIAQTLGFGANGSGLAYVGFTGNAGSSTQTITNFSFTGGGLVPVSLVPNNNAVLAQAGTSSTIQVGTSTGSTTETIPSLTIAAGAVVHLTQANGSNGVLLLQTPSLSIAGTVGAWTGTLDIGKGDLDLPTPGSLSPSQNLAIISSMAASGYKKGTWAGTGINSSAAGADTTHLTAVGVILNDTNQAGGGTALYGPGGISSTFDGSTVGQDDVLVKYTYYGDANLDGGVDGSDYALVDATYLAEGFIKGVATTPASGWYNGDFNYDGVVNGSDYTLMDNAYNQQGLSLGVNPLALTATSTALVAGGGSAVPEPSTLALLAIGSAATLGRRRRRN